MPPLGKPKKGLQGRGRVEEARGGSWLSSGMGVHGEHSPRQALGKVPHLPSPSQASPPTYLEERSGGEGGGGKVCSPRQVP